MHIIQQKILNLSKLPLKISLRGLGRLIGEDHPQKIKHHLEQLEKKGFIIYDHQNQIIKRSGKSFASKQGLILVPVIGSADCGEAKIFAEENLEGYIKISRNLLDKKRDIFAVKAIGDSMNKAEIKGKNIEDGDYVIIDGNEKTPNNNDYVLSIIENQANIKKYLIDKTNSQIILLPESTKDYPPIFINIEDDLNYLICGKVIQVIKNPKNNSQGG